MTDAKLKKDEPRSERVRQEPATPVPDEAPGQTGVAPYDSARREEVLPESVVTEAPAPPPDPGNEIHNEQPQEIIPRRG